MDHFRSQFLSLCWVHFHIRLNESPSAAQKVEKSIRELADGCREEADYEAARGCFCDERTFTRSFCLPLSGSHLGAVPAGLQQQPLLHHLLHALLPGASPAEQRHAPVSPASLPAVGTAAEAVQPDRYQEDGSRRRKT